PAERLDSRLQLSPDRRAALADGLWESVVRGVPRFAFPALVALLGFFTALAMRRAPSPGLAPPASARCGAPYCVVCGVRAAMGTECEGCLSLALGNPILDPVFKQERRRTVEIERIKLLWTARVLGLLVPGGGHVMLGATGRGFAILAAWTVLMARLL